MKQVDFLRVGEATDRDQFQGRLVEFAHGLGFDKVSAALVIDQPGTDESFTMIGNTPQAFLEASRDPDASRRDPVLRRLKASPLPFVYDQTTYVDEGAGDLWEEQAPFGYRTGISMALHMDSGRHFLLGVDREQPLPTDDAQCMRLIADVQLLAVYAQETAVRVLGPAAALLAPVPRLTPREREVLQWTRAGKSSWAIGQILSLSENTVNTHIRRAMTKLDASSRHVAVLRATSLGII